MGRMMARKAPGKAHREGLSIIELMDMFPSEEKAASWFEAQVWLGRRCCGHCGSMKTSEVPNATPMPYWCSGLPELLQRAHRHRPLTLEDSVA